MVKFYLKGPHKEFTINRNSYVYLDTDYSFYILEIKQINFISI